MKKIILHCLVIILSLLMVSNTVSAQKNASREYYKLTVYHYKTADQEKVLDSYLEHALLPALHRQKVEHIGVFKAIANDTAADKTLYVFMPFKSLSDVAQTFNKLSSDNAYTTAGSDYLNAAYNNPPYTRMETIILYAFPLAPKMELPSLTSAKSERIYELRSYESASEKIFRNKVHMFNEGGEVPLFKRLGFNAVFYSEVVAGSKMPNLMYMTTFDNMQSHDAHWKAFVDDPEWKTLSAKPEYQHNVQHIDIYLLRPTIYSDF